MLQTGGAGKHQGVRLNDLVNISGNNLEEFAPKMFICSEIEKNGATVQGFILMCDPPCLEGQKHKCVPICE